MGLFRYFRELLSPGHTEIRDALAVRRRTDYREHFIVDYSLDERRVARYLSDRTGIGGGEDPIGFLIASHRMLADERRRLCEYLLETLGSVRGADPIDQLIASHRYMLAHWTPPADAPAQPPEEA